MMVPLVRGSHAVDNKVGLYAENVDLIWKPSYHALVIFDRDAWARGGLRLYVSKILYVIGHILGLRYVTINDRRQVRIRTKALFGTFIIPTRGAVHVKSEPVSRRYSIRPSRQLVALYSQVRACIKALFCTSIMSTHVRLTLVQRYKNP